MMCGGLNDAQDATDEIQDLCNQFKGDVETKAGKKFAIYEALKYRSQVVAGTNYFVKICVGGDEHVHVRIFKPLPHTKGPPEFGGIQTGKSLSDDLEYF